MLRVAHSLGFIAISPSKQQVANQAAMAVIPLVMEPESKLYLDPVLVLDFQALYPSMIIAYNLCFSTCMGKLRSGERSHGALTVPRNDTASEVEGDRINNPIDNEGLEDPEDGEFPHREGNLANVQRGDDSGVPAVEHGEQDTTSRLGVVEYPEDLTVLNLLDQRRKNPQAPPPYVSPNGSLFCAREVREGILPQMLREILHTRLMTKRAMKRCLTSSVSEGGRGRDDVANAILSRVLDARQLALKMIANVTYGYTAAGFSGRMPMAELADAVVQCGRSTLEWTIREISSHPR